MKATAYLRVGKKKHGRARTYVIDARAGKPLHTPLTERGQVLPTVAFALELDIPDELFERAGQVIATVEIPEDEATIAAEVHQ